MKKYATGMTLVELMIVMVIIGIIMAVAVPSYRTYALRAHRADAMATLNRIAAAQEKFYLNNNTYATNAQLATPPPGGLGLSKYSEYGYYTITLNDAYTDLTRGYQIIAIGAGAQKTDDYDCRVFAIDHRGNRYGGPGPVNNASTHDPKCWGE